MSMLVLLLLPMLVSSSILQDIEVRRQPSKDDLYQFDDDTVVVVNDHLATKTSAQSSPEVQTSMDLVPSMTSNPYQYQMFNPYYRPYVARMPMYSQHYYMPQFFGPSEVRRRQSSAAVFLEKRGLRREKDSERYWKMSSQVGAINSVTALIGRVFQQPKGDFADRLNSRLTVCILALSAVIMLSGHFMGDPINCWSPAQFTKQWQDFVNQYCYVHGTYFVALDEQLEFEADDRRKQPITYYQWVPYILAVQAFLFYLPRFVWKALVAYSGYDLAGAIRYVDKFWSTVKDNDASFKSRIAMFEGRPSVYIWDGLRLARRKKSRDMALYYSISTVLQAINAWFQWLWLNNLLGSPHYTLWGPNLVLDLAAGADWQKTGHFPRITHCDFQRRRPASVQLDTVLCVLGLNIYYEKLFIFLWFWFLFVALVSTWNCARWMARLCIRSTARSTVETYLQSQPGFPTDVSKERFYRALGSDGLFILQQMSENLGDMPTSYLTIAMRNLAGCINDDSDDEEINQPLAKHTTAKFV